MPLSPSNPSIIALAAACPPIPEHVREIVAEEKTLSEAGARFAEILDAVTVTPVADVADVVAQALEPVADAARTAA